MSRNCTIGRVYLAVKSLLWLGRVDASKPDGCCLFSCAVWCAPTSEILERETTVQAGGSKKNRVDKEAPAGAASPCCKDNLAQCQFQ